MRLVPKKPVLCDLETCQFRGQYLTCYHDTGKVKYNRCQNYGLNVRVPNEPKTHRGLEGNVGGKE